MIHIQNTWRLAITLLPLGCLIEDGIVMAFVLPTDDVVMPTTPSVSTPCTTTTSNCLRHPSSGRRCCFTKTPLSRLYATTGSSKKDDEEVLGPLADAKIAGQPSFVDADKAATGTVNERLIAELQEAADKEKYGARSEMGKKLGLDSFKSSKTDEEREAAIQEARDLNGVNPVVALGGSLFALAAAAALWSLTSYLAEYFALHPVNSEVYFVSRVSAVFRNIVMGLVSLASGFFGVTGMGIFLLGVRVAYGVTTGELDPTPLKKKQKEQVDMPNVWELMMNKKPGDRRNRK